MDLTQKQIEAMFAAVDHCNLADIKQVVRCKDCRYHNNCEIEIAGQFSDNSYCCYGARMDGDKR